MDYVSRIGEEVGGSSSSASQDSADGDLEKKIENYSQSIDK